MFIGTRKSCFFLQNRLLLLYCSSVSMQLFQLHCCVYKVFTAPLMLLLFQQCFACITVSTKLLLHLGSWKMSSIHEFQIMLKSHFCCCQVISKYQRQRVSKSTISRVSRKTKILKMSMKQVLKNTAWHHQIRVQT